MTGATLREVLPDAEALARRGAEFVLQTCQQASGDLRVCLAGGTTPKRMYELLATPEFAPRMPWARVHWFWGDERFVPKEDPSNNYRNTRIAMFGPAAVPVTHIHPVRTVGTTPDQAATEYERLLQSAYGSATLDPARPLFDVVLLGFGDDGHCASLFPGTAVLSERRRWAAAVVGVKPEPRITLTYPTLESARHLVVLGAGAGKHEVLQRIQRGDDLPIAHVRPVGTLHWLLDRAAAEGA